MSKVDENIIDFPGPLKKEEVIEYGNKFETGIMLCMDESKPAGVSFTFIGSPTSAELLWMSEQLRLRALYDNDEIDYAEEDDPA